MENVIFDLDDTLIPSSMLYNLTLKSMAIDQELFEKSRAEIKENIDARSTQAHSRLLYFKRYLESQGKFSATGLSEMYSIYGAFLTGHLQEWLSSNSDRVLLLRGLKERGFRLYLATNETLQMQLIKLSCLDPDGTLFDGFLCSEEAGSEKPNKHFYEILLKKFPIQPEKSFFIGDNKTCDCDAPARFGFKTFLVNEFASVAENKITLKHVVDML